MAIETCAIVADETQFTKRADGSLEIPADAKTYFLTLDELGEAVSAYLIQKHGWTQHSALGWSADPSKAGEQGKRIPDPTYITVIARMW